MDILTLHGHRSTLTLKVLFTIIDAQWQGMGDVGLARYEPALLPPPVDVSSSRTSVLVNARPFKVTIGVPESSDLNA